MEKGDLYVLFLKETNNKKGTYLQIYEVIMILLENAVLIVLTNLWGMYTNFRLPALRIRLLFLPKRSRNLIRNANRKNRQKKNNIISDVSPEKHLGYFPLKNINDSLGCKRFIDLMQTATNFRFNIFDMMSALIYARTVHPCSKSKTYDEVIPNLFENHDFSLDQLYSGLEYIGSEYEKVIEIYNHQINQTYPLDNGPHITLIVQTFTLRLIKKMISD